MSRLARVVRPDDPDCTCVRAVGGGAGELKRGLSPCLENSNVGCPRPLHQWLNNLRRGEIEISGKNGVAFSVRGQQSMLIQLRDRFRKAFGSLINTTQYYRPSIVRFQAPVMLKSLKKLSAEMLHCGYCKGHPSRKRRVSPAWSGSQPHCLPAVCPEECYRSVW